VKGRLAILLVSALTCVGCDVGTRPDSFVITGPSVPSPVPTNAPYVWDTTENLAIWVNNPVTKGNPVLDVHGSDASIRIDPADKEWVLRGPDLVPAATGVQTLRIRYKWQPDPSLPANASRTMLVTAYFQTVAPIGWLDPNDQAAAVISLQPQQDWTEVRFSPNQYTPPIDVRYCYLHSRGGNRGVLEIDRIELVQ